MRNADCGLNGAADGKSSQLVSSDALQTLVGRLLVLGPASGPPAELVQSLASQPPKVVEALVRFFQACSDDSGRLRRALREATRTDAVRLDWPGRGSYCMAAAGQEVFIHPAMGESLRAAFDPYLRELCLPNLHDPPERGDIEPVLTRIPAIRALGNRLIDWIAHAHEERLHAWLARPAIAEVHYCITLDRVPARFYPEIAANNRQRLEWVRLYLIDRIEPGLMQVGYSEPLQAAFLEQNPFLMLDTRLFPRDFVDRLVGAMTSLDGQLDGVLIHGDNFRALRLLEEQGSIQVDCIYTDPPYNTGGADLPYQDRYARPTWLTMMENRFRIAHRLLKPGGACFVSIDENEQAAMELLLSEIFSPGDFVASLVWEAGRKNDSKLVSVSHEYMLCYVKDLAQPAQKRLTWRVRKEGIDEIHAKAGALVRRFGGDYARASSHLKHWLAGLPDNHPAKRHRHYCCVDQRGVYHAGNISWPGGGGPTYEVLHPVTGRPCKVPSRGWMYPTAERMTGAIREGLVHFGPDETRVPCAKVYLRGNEQHAPGSVFYRDGRAAMKRLRDLLGSDSFANPKDEKVIAERIGPALPPDGTVLDFFGGSGSTAHAVMNLNRIDGGRRKYILVEIGDSFETVLRTRIQRAAYSRRWRRGVPGDREGVSHAFKCVRLASFQ